MQVEPAILTVFKSRVQNVKGVAMYTAAFYIEVVGGCIKEYV